MAINPNLDENIDTFEVVNESYHKTRDKLVDELMVALEQLYDVDSKTTQLPINGKIYSFDLLLKNRKYLFLATNPQITKQIQALFSNLIYGKDVTKSTDQLVKYRLIAPFLVQLATNQEVKSLKISGQNYSFISLLTDLNKRFVNLSIQSFNELQALVENAISLAQLEVAYQEAVLSIAAQKKKAKLLRTLAISLGTIGGIIFVAGSGFGLSYYLIRIKKLG